MKKEDEIDIKIQTETWSRMYDYAGGIKILLPFLCLLAAFA